MQTDITVPVMCDEEHPRFQDLTHRLATLYRAAEDKTLIGIQLRKKKGNKDVAVLMVPVDDGGGFIPLGELYYSGYEPEITDFVTPEGMDHAPTEETPQ